MASTIHEAMERLIVKFQDNADHYRSPAYNETLCRIDFINPMFKCLGWDMENEKGYADAYRDVIHEDAIKIGSATKAPDYCFRIGGTRKFFLVSKNRAWSSGKPPGNVERGEGGGGELELRRDLRRHLKPSEGKVPDGRWRLYEVARRGVGE